MVYENPKEPEGSVYDEVLLEIEGILGQQGVAKSNPMNPELTRFRSIGDTIRAERKFHASGCSASYIFRVFTIIVSVLLLELTLMKRCVFDLDRYKKDMRKYAEFKKFDGMLRMVIDCTKDQANAIEFMLQDKHLHGQRLFYGVFYSTHSLMTCTGDGVNDGEHIHFMDGDAGGFAMAAKALNQQMAVMSQTEASFAVHDHLNLRASLLDDDDSVGKMESKSCSLMNPTREGGEQGFVTHSKGGSPTSALNTDPRSTGRTKRRSFAKEAYIYPESESKEQGFDSHSNEGSLASLHSGPRPRTPNHSGADRDIFMAMDDLESGCMECEAATRENVDLEYGHRDFETDTREQKPKKDKKSKKDKARKDTKKKKKKRKKTKNSGSHVSVSSNSQVSFPAGNSSSS